jgi:hypothetical protein
MIQERDSKLIGEALTKFVQKWPTRVRIRYSNGGDDHFMTANTEGMKASGIVCPQQTGKTKNCGTCCLCWTITKNITFINHSRPMKKDHHSLVNGTTVFLKTLRSVEEVKTVLKFSSNDKLGKKVVKGVWKDHKFLTLTLEERATCPPSCKHWDDCYGNGMRFADRIKIEGLMEAIERDLAALPKNKMFVIRLHVLGDFFSTEYVEFWDRMVEKFDNIKIFGYTAHPVNNDHLRK